MPSAGLAFADLRIPSVFRLLGIALCLSAIAQPYQGGERVRALSDRILAPCCWREAVSVHQSPAAENIRKQIADAVAAGESDESIVATLIREHGKRILREPEGSERDWLYWTPVVFILFAFLVLSRFLKRSAAVASLAVPSSSGLADVDEILSEN